MKYNNQSNSPLELVVELLISLESTELIKDFIYNVKTIYIDEDNEKKSTGKCIVLNGKHLNELAMMDYLSDEDFNMLVINRFSEDLKSYTSLHKETDQNHIRLRLVDYSDIVRETLKGKSLKALFILKKESDRNDEFHRLKKLLSMEEELENDPELFSRKEALNRLCLSLNEDQESINTNDNSPEYKEEQFNNLKRLIEEPSTLNFVKVPHMFTTDSKSKTYHSIDSSHQLYKKYIAPLIDYSTEKEYQYYYTDQKTEKNIDTFNNLAIFGTFEKLEDYLLLLTEYKNTTGQPRYTFTKALKRENRRTLNPTTADRLSKAAHGEKDYKVQPVDGLLAQCFWTIHKEKDILNSFTRMEMSNNITDYLDTLIRYYIFINEELLQRVLPKFAKSNVTHYNAIVRKRDDAEKSADSRKPIAEDKRTHRIKKYEKLRVEASKFHTVSPEIIRIGEKVIKDHFHYDILKEIVKLYVNAIEHHEVILKESGFK